MAIIKQIGPTGPFIAMNCHMIQYFQCWRKLSPGKSKASKQFKPVKLDHCFALGVPLHTLLFNSVDFVLIDH